LLLVTTTGEIFKKFILKIAALRQQHGNIQLDTAIGVSSNLSISQSKITLKLKKILLQPFTKKEIIKPFFKKIKIKLSLNIKGFF